MVSGLLPLLRPSDRRGWCLLLAGVSAGRDGEGWQHRAPKPLTTLVIRIVGQLEQRLLPRTCRQLLRLQVTITLAGLRYGPLINLLQQLLLLNQQRSILCTTDSNATTTTPESNAIIITIVTRLHRLSNCAWHLGAGSKPAQQLRPIL